MDALTRYTSFRDFVARTFSEATQQAVDKALVFAAEKMEQYARYDGRPLLDHDVAVAEIVAVNVARLVVKTDLLDGGFAIDEQDVLSVGFELVSEFVDSILAKMNPRRILVGEVV